MHDELSDRLLNACRGEYGPPDVVGGAGPPCGVCGERIPWGSHCYVLPDGGGLVVCPVCWAAQGFELMCDAFAELGAAEQMELLGVRETLVL